MATYNEDVVINGGLTVNEQDNTDQVIVKASSGQTSALQEWQDASGNAQAELTADGRFRVGSDLIGGTPNALVEANEQITLPTTDPKQGIQSKGVLDGGATAISEPLTWSAQEMEIKGTGGLSSTHSTLVARISQQNTGTASAAEVQAGYFEAENEGSSTGTLTGIEAQLINSGQVTNAAGLKIEQPQNTGTITNLYGVKIQNIAQGTNNYALHTGTGKVHLGDVLEMAEQGSAPATPPAGNLVLYPSAGLLRLKDSSGAVKTLVDLDSTQTLTSKTLTSPVISGGTINNAVIGGTVPAAGTFTTLQSNNSYLGIAGTSATVPVTIRGAASQSANLLTLQNSALTVVGGFNPDGRLGVGQVPQTNTWVIVNETVAITSSADFAGFFALTINAASSSSAQLNGVIGQANVAGTQAQTGLIMPLRASANVTNTNTTSDIQVTRIEAGNTGSGTITNLTNLRIIPTINNGGGTITNLLGVDIGDMNVGSTLNIAIRTLSGHIVFNENGDANTDFRVEGDTDQNLLFTDASANRVAIGTGTPAGKLHITNTIASDSGLIVRGAASQSADLMQLQNSSSTVLSRFNEVGSLGIGVDPASPLHVMVFDAATATASEIFYLEHQSSGTPTTGFGNIARFRGHSSTNTIRNMGDILVIWDNATDASRAATMHLRVHDSVGARTGMVLTATGTGVIASLAPTTVDTILTVQHATASPEIRVSGAAGTARNLIFQTAGANRWIFRADTASESGSNVGSDFRLFAIDDAGTGVIGTPIIIQRSALSVQLSNSVIITQATLGNEVFRIQSTTTNDDPSERHYQNRVTTTDATVTTLHTFTVPASTTYQISAIVTARRTGGTAGTAEDGAGYEVKAVYKNVAGTATLIGSTITPIGESQAAWDVTLSPSGANVLLRVTGAANNNITWHMTARVYQVSS